MLDDRLERPRLFEEVRGAGHDDELLFTAQLGERGAIEGQHLDIIAADDQQGRSILPPGRAGPARSGTAAPRNDRGDRPLMRRCCNERRCRAGAGAEISDKQIAGLGILSDPGGRHQQPPREQLDVENIATVARLFDGQEVEEQCGKAILPQSLRNKVVARAEPAAAAAMREQHDPLGIEWQTQKAFEPNRCDRNCTDRPAAIYRPWTLPSRFREEAIIDRCAAAALR